MQTALSCKPEVLGQRSASHHPGKASTTFCIDAWIALQPVAGRESNASGDNLQKLIHSPPAICSNCRHCMQAPSRSKPKCHQPSQPRPSRASEVSDPSSPMDLEDDDRNKAAPSNRPGSKAKPSARGILGRAATAGANPKSGQAVFQLPAEAGHQNGAFTGCSAGYLRLVHLATPFQYGHDRSICAGHAACSTHLQSHKAVIVPQDLHGRKSSPDLFKLSLQASISSTEMHLPARSCISS